MIRPTSTTFVLTLATGSSYIIDHFLLMPFGLEYLRTLSFIVTIAAIVLAGIYLQVAGAKLLRSKAP